mgnify:CR=1 FL=1
MAHASFFTPVLKTFPKNTFAAIFPCTPTHALIKTKDPMQVAAVYRHEIVMRSRFRSSGGQNDKRRRSSSAAKERLMRNCSELFSRENRCGQMRPQAATFLYSIKDSSDDDTCDDGSYYGIIEVGAYEASSLVDHFHDASPWRTTLENVRTMNLHGKYVSLTNISATCTNAPTNSWIEVARAFHESGAKSVKYKNM